MNYFEGWDTKLGQLGIGLAAFFAVIALLFFVVSRGTRKGRDWLAICVFAGPAIILLLAGLVYPASRTIWQSFFNKDSTEFVGLANYAWVFQDAQTLIAIRNTITWVVFTPILSAGIGLVYAVLIDRARFEKIAKTLLFMPMAISFVGAGIIWKFIYAYKGPKLEQIGLLNAIIVGLGGEPQQFLLNAPLNTFFLIVVMVWIQAGFAMVLLSASIKAIPIDIVEAARLDGANGWQMFRRITLPSIRPTLVVVWTTISIAVLKVFDIVRTMTGGQFDTSVLANSMYDNSFRYAETGRGATLAVVLFLLVVPLVAYNIRQMSKNRAIR